MRLVIKCVLLLQDFLDNLGAFPTIEVCLAPISAMLHLGMKQLIRGLTPAVKQVVPSWDLAAVSEFQG